MTEWSDWHASCFYRSQERESEGNQMVANRIKKLKSGALLVVMALFLVACGSGGGSGSSENVQTPGSGSNPGGQKSGVTVSNTYSQPKDLGVGDLLYVDLSQSKNLDFSGVNSSSTFTLVMANTSTSYESYSYQMSGDLNADGIELAKAIGADIPEAEEAPVDYIDDDLNDFTASFHDALRFREQELEELEPVESGFSLSKSASTNNASMAVGDAKVFKVLASLSSSSTVNVNATAKCVGSNVAFYLDDRVGSEMMSDADVQSLCTRFDSDAQKEQNIFGSYSDINGDGKVVVLLTPQVNALGAQGGGIITGFFSASDLYTSSSSNSMEILYIMVPDPNGAYGSKISNSFAMNNLLPPVLVHELQHAISYNQHVLINKGKSEEAWLNEGLSHLSEDLLGHNQENPSRFSIFLRSPHSYSLVTKSSPGLGSRGAAYLFLRFLYEQASDKSRFVANLLQTQNSGIKNVEVSFGGTSADFDQFEEFFLRWTIALAMSDQGISQDSRFTYQARGKDSSTGKWGGVCISCEADDGRGTSLNGASTKMYSGYQYQTNNATAARFYTVTDVKSQLKLESLGNTGQGFGVLIRTK